jgi:CRP-like cAMP-binding protein
MPVLRRTKSPRNTPTAGNRLLDRLPAQVRTAVLRTATLRSFRAEEELIKPGTPLRKLLFPTTVVCSILTELRSGQRAETGTVGNEGFVGISAVLGTKTTEYVVAQTPGEGYEVRVAHLEHLFSSHKSLRRAMMRFIGYAYHLAKQTLVCHAYHSVEQRLARCLLAAHDRSAQDEFEMTQEVLSQTVAATRPRVTEAAGRLRAIGVIDYQRGRIRIRNRKRLEATACECYEATRLPR